MYDERGGGNEAKSGKSTALSRSRQLEKYATCSQEAQGQDRARVGAGMQ